MSPPPKPTPQAAHMHSIAKMRFGLETQATSISEILDITLQRIAAGQDVTNAFVEVLGDEAAAEAAQADQAMLGGKAPGPLAGIPFAAKAAFDISGRATTGCSNAVMGAASTADAEVVARLRSAGAMLVGITNQHELGAGATGLVSANGPMWNPHEPKRLAGGSSGGSAIAVASGAVPIAIGVDTGGSVRIPASFCGCWGLKPSQGRLSTQGVLPLSPSLDCPGVLTASTDDLSRCWSVLDEDIGNAGLPRRVGVLAGGRWARQATSARVALRAAEQSLKDAGVEVVEVDGTGIDDALRVWSTIAWSEFAQTFADVHTEELQPDTAVLHRWGTNRAAEGLGAPRARQLEIRNWFLRHLRRVDALMSPTTPYSAPLASELDVIDSTGERLNVRRGGPSWFTAPVSLAGLPAISAPFDGGELPIGVQLIGTDNDELGLLALAHVLEAGGSFSSRFLRDV